MTERAPTWAKKPPQKCGTCKHLRPRSDGKPFWHGHAYACLWQPPRITFPSSWNARRCLEYSASSGAYMSPSGGKDCPCWERANPVVKEKDDE